jgi:hypothetical protein
VKQFVIGIGARIKKSEIENEKFERETDDWSDNIPFAS